MDEPDKLRACLEYPGESVVLLAIVDPAYKQAMLYQGQSFFIDRIGRSDFKAYFVNVRASIRSQEVDRTNYEN